MGKAYNLENILVTWGSDFGYFDAYSTFGLIDDIILFLKKRASNLKFIYSTVE